VYARVPYHCLLDQCNRPPVPGCAAVERKVARERAARVISDLRSYLRAGRSQASSNSACNEMHCGAASTSSRRHLRIHVSGPIEMIGTPRGVTPESTSPDMQPAPTSAGGAGKPAAGARCPPRARPCHWVPPLRPAPSSCPQQLPHPSPLPSPGAPAHLSRSLCSERHAAMLSRASRGAPSVSSRSAWQQDRSSAARGCVAGSCSARRVRDLQWLALRSRRTPFGGLEWGADH
jgi:hypothetical protein